MRDPSFQEHCVAFLEMLNQDPTLLVLNLKIQARLGAGSVGSSFQLFLKTFVLPSGTTAREFSGVILQR